MGTQALTQLLQEVVDQAEEAGDRVLGLSGVDLGFLSSLRSLRGDEDMRVRFHLLETVLPQ